MENIVKLNEIAVGEYMPEFTIFLDLSPAEAFARKGGADKTDRMESVDYSFHEKVVQRLQATDSAKSRKVCRYRRFRHQGTDSAKTA